MDLSYSQQWYSGVAMTSSPNGQDQCSQGKKITGRVWRSLNVYTYE